MECPSFLRLKAAAQQPFDLTAETAVSQERLERFSASGGSYKLIYALERLDENVLNALFQLAEERGALEKMARQQAGEKVNTFENRMVLHTAMRDFFSEKNPANEAQLAAGLAFVELEKLKSFQKKHQGRFDYLIHIGIGGSQLGPEMVFEALKLYSRETIKPFFLGNLDPDEVFSILKLVDLKRTLIAVVSKSGSTMETKVNELMVREALKKAGLNPAEQIVSITTPGSLMDDPKRYLEVFYFWDYVGGRFSVTSMAGAFSLGLSLGFELFFEFLKGASRMDKLALKKDQSNLPLLLALLGIWKRNFLKLPTLAVVPYCSSLKKFCLYLQQVEMESNGKSVDLKQKALAFSSAPFVFGDSGSNAQHSFFQMLHQG
ncbi:MAG: glucose-6-phosphate isomerase, partial [Parachlamydiales bacterium]